MNTNNTPRKLFRLSLGLLVASTVALSSPTGVHAFGLGGGTKADVESEKSIRKIYSEFEAAWNAHDHAKLSMMWSVDGDHVEPDGTVAKGRPEVAALLAKQHVGVFKTTKLKLAIRSVWMISDTVALIDGTYEITGIALPDGTAIPARSGLLSSVLLLEKDQWSIVASRLMIPAPLPYKPSAAAAQ